MSTSLLELTTQRLSAREIPFHLEADGAVRIAAKCPELGDIQIAFEDGEVSVFVGDITHSHFTPFEAYDNFKTYTPEDAADDAVEFVAEIIADAWIIWKYPDGFGGCYKIDGDVLSSADAPLSGEGVESFVWSGPLRAA
jgi:hypothetical protein